jgi:hypothetical protein
VHKNASFVASATLADHSSKCGNSMTQEDVLAPHTYTVELRFIGQQLEPLNISRRLGLAASAELSLVQGQAGKKRREPFWAYNGKGEVGFQSEWTSLEEALQFLLGCLHSRKSEIAAIAREFRAIWWCGHFQTSFDGGPTLSPDLMAEVGSYGIPLSIDNYFSDT